MGFYSPQLFEANLKTAFFFFLLLLLFVRHFVKINFYSLEGMCGHAWACLGMLGHAWACLGMLRHAGEGFHVLIGYMFLLLVSSYI